MCRCSRIIFLLAIILLISGCSNRAKEIDIENSEELTRYSEFLSLRNCGALTLADIRSPWGTEWHYAFVSNDTENPEIPEGYVIVKTPLEKSIVFSSVYTSAINELGHIDAVKGVADGSYFMADDTVTQLIKKGKIADVGSSMAPLAEKIIDIEPDGILLSPYAGGGSSSSAVHDFGVPVIQMADYLESSPLGRAEWILLIGELYGERDLAHEIFSETERNYLGLVEMSKKMPTRPKVITEKPMSGVWYVPGGKSYMARMIHDAGGIYSWADTPENGSIPLDEAAIIDAGADADIWLIKDTKKLTADRLQNEVPHARALRPFAQSTFACNTLSKRYYDVIAFHPDKILLELIKILHPEAFKDINLNFYEPIE